MKAWVLEQHADPQRAFVLREVPDPDVRPGQLLIRSEGFGLNYADVMASRGLYREAPPIPCILGYETVGRVERVGEGVSPALVGQRVVALTRFGGYAELAVTDHRAAVQVPDDMPVGVAAALATQGATAWYASTFARALHAGDRVLVHAAAGGVGQLLVMIAVHRGCEVFALAKGEEKMHYLRSLGAQHVIDRGTGDYAEAMRLLLGKHKLDVSFNAVGGSTYKKDMALIGGGGAIVLYGGAERGSGKGPLATLRFVWNMGLVLPIFLMMQSRSLLGVNMLKISDHKPELLGRCMQEVIAAAREGWIRPHVYREYSRTELPEAITVLASGRTMGKVVVRW
jgi:NADPH2:quinone reductase